MGLGKPEGMAERTLSERVSDSSELERARPHLGRHRRSRQHTVPRSRGRSQKSCTNAGEDRSPSSNVSERVSKTPESGTCYTHLARVTSPRRTPEAFTLIKHFKQPPLPNLTTHQHSPKHPHTTTDFNTRKNPRTLSRSSSHVTSTSPPPSRNTPSSRKPSSNNGLPPPMMSVASAPEPGKQGQEPEVRERRERKRESDGQRSGYVMWRSQSSWGHWG